MSTKQAHMTCTPTMRCAACFSPLKPATFGHYACNCNSPGRYRHLRGSYLAPVPPESPHTLDACVTSKHGRFISTETKGVNMHVYVILDNVERVGPSTPDNSMVTCPQCTSRFLAISVDDQQELNDSRARIQESERRREDLLAKFKDVCESHADTQQKVIDLQFQVNTLKLRLFDAEKARELTQTRYAWVANELLACDYGDNNRDEMGWRVYGWRDRTSERRIYGPTIDAAVDAAVAKERKHD